MRRKTPRYLALIALLTVAAIVPLASKLLDRLFAPWAFPHGGDPALAGTWVGSLTTATGRPLGALVTIRLPEPGGRGGLVRDWENAPQGELGGTARLCDARGEVRSYTIDGEPEDRHASHLRFFLAPVDSPPPNGLRPDWVNGGWDRANRLDLRVSFHWERDGGAISGGGYPDTESDATLQMTRGGDEEFQVICAGLARRNGRSS